jgi:hypothetical protein
MFYNIKLVNQIRYNYEDKELILSPFAICTLQITSFSEK